MNFLTNPLDASKHDRHKFTCGKPMLDIYIRLQAKQDVRRKLSACFVMVDNETSLISGYYTLSSNSISNDLVPDSFRKNLPNSYSSVPTILIGRLAIDVAFQGKGLGKMLLVDSLKRCFDASKTIGAFAVIVDPLDNEAEEFYAKYGFIKLPDSGKMFLPMKTISQIFE